MWEREQRHQIERGNDTQNIHIENRKTFTAWWASVISTAFGYIWYFVAQSTVKLKRKFKMRSHPHSKELRFIEGLYKTCLFDSLKDFV